MSTTYCCPNVSACDFKRVYSEEKDDRIALTKAFSKHYQQRSCKHVVQDYINGRIFNVPTEYTIYKNREMKAAPLPSSTSSSSSSSSSSSTTTTQAVPITTVKAESSPSSTPSSSSSSSSSTSSSSYMSEEADTNKRISSLKPIVDLFSTLLGEEVLQLVTFITPGFPTYELSDAPFYILDLKQNDVSLQLDTNTLADLTILYATKSNDPILSSSIQSSVVSHSNIVNVINETLLSSQSASSNDEDISIDETAESASSSTLLSSSSLALSSLSTLSSSSTSTVLSSKSSSSTSLTPSLSSSSSSSSSTTTKSKQSQKQPFSSFAQKRSTDKISSSSTLTSPDDESSLSSSSSSSQKKRRVANTIKVQSNRKINDDQLSDVIASFSHLDNIISDTSNPYQLGFIGAYMNIKETYNQLSHVDQKKIDTVFTSLNKLAEQIEILHDHAKLAFDNEQRIPSTFDPISADSKLSMGFYKTGMQTQYNEYDFADLMYDNDKSSSSSSSSSALHILSPIPGFSKHNVQLYSKRLLSWTTFHSEIGYATAYNINHHHSKGVSFWLGFNLNAALRVMNRNELDSIMHNSDITVIDLIKLIKTITKLQHDGRREKFYITIQYPNMTVVAPASPLGNIHGVLSIGSYLFQTAWNRSMNIESLHTCLNHYKQLPTISNNSGLATRSILPCLRLQYLLGWRLGLENELKHHDHITASIGDKYPNSYVVVMDRNTPAIRSGRQIVCQTCEKIIDLYMIDSKCYQCFMNEQEEEEQIE